MLASRIAIAGPTSNTTRRVVGQWGGMPVNVNAGRGRSETPLTWTILYSHYETAILLLRRGAAFEGPLSLLDEGNHHREPGFERVDELMADVKAAGSWAVYAREPRRKMLVLAKLCEKGRATPPRRDRVLGTLFDGGSRRGTASVVIPREVFWKVFEFWPCSY